MRCLGRAQLHAPAPQAIDRPTASDQDEPSRYRRLPGIVPSGLVPYLKKRLLQNLLCITKVTEDLVGQSLQQASVAIEELGQRTLIAVGDRTNQDLVIDGVHGAESRCERR